MAQHEVDTTVFGGLPITVEFNAYYEDGECGYPGYVIEGWAIIAVGSRPCKRSPNWIMRKLTKADEEKITEDCFAAIDY